jgi:hypothetical protein
MEFLNPNGLISRSVAVSGGAWVYPGERPTRSRNSGHSLKQLPASAEAGRAC